MTNSTKLAILAAMIAIVALGAHRYGKRAYHMARGVVSRDATASAAPATPLPPVDPKTVPPTVIGMNLSGLNYYNRENALWDPVKNHGTFGISGQSFTKDGVDLKDQVSRDANLGLLNVPPGTQISAQLGGVQHISGTLQCHVSPGWKINQVFAIVQQNGTKFTINRPPDAKDSDGTVITLTNGDRAADLTDLGCRPRGVPESALFRADFLNDLKPFGVLRFLNWMLANGEPPTTWAKRPMPGDLSFVDRGMPVEYMVDLANQNRSDPWFTLPFDADDDYQRRFATYVRDHLSPDLKVYAELSNEVWNSGFPQSKAATRLGKLRYPGEDDAHATDYYYGDRLRHMMAIWTQVFAGQPRRLVRVASSQAAWPDRASYILGHGDTAKSVDVLAIAPYFGDMPFGIDGTGARRVDAIFTKMPGFIDQAIGFARRNKAIANRFGLRLVAYESGTAFDAFEPVMKADVMALLHDPRMATHYANYITRWTKEVGGEMLLFDTMDGVWAHMEHTGQPWREAPKMAGAVNVIAGLPQGKARGIQPVTPAR